MGKQTASAMDEALDEDDREDAPNSETDALKEVEHELHQPHHAV